MSDSTSDAPPENTSPPMKVECTECPFSEVIANPDGELPADTVIAHGKDTGHTLRVESLAE